MDHGCLSVGAMVFFCTYNLYQNGRFCEIDKHLINLAVELVTQIEIHLPGAITMNYKKINCFQIPFRVSVFSAWGIVVIRGLQALIPATFAVLTADIVNHVVGVEKNHIALIVPQLAALLVLILFQFGGSTLMSLLYTQIKTRVQECFDKEILRKVSLLPYHRIEDKQTYELIQRIGKDYEKKIVDGFRTYLRAAGNALQLISILWVILRAKAWWSAVVLLIFSVPLVFVSMTGGRKNYDASVQAAAEEQRAVYLNEVLLGREAALERNIFNFSGWMQEKWKRQFGQAQQLQNRAQAKTIMRMKLSSILTVIVSVIVCVMLVPPVMQQTMDMGTFFGLTTAVFNFVTLVSWEIADTFSQLVQSWAYNRDLADFFALEEMESGKKSAGIIPENIEITFENVSFRYPGCKNYILQDVNITLQSGRHYAIVGLNGAGKSTMIKLMSGLYTDYEGVILINGKDIRNFSDDELGMYFSIAWQDFSRYNISLREYFELGGKAEESVIWEWLRLFEMDQIVSSWPKGLETSLGRLKKDGKEVSQGQWQRLMLIKTLLQKGQVKIFDEPTSAIDPVGESKLYEQIAGWTKGRLSIFITHRLGAARMADEILVLDGGTITEKGTHDELIELQGLYAEMYNTQKEWYVNASKG